MNLIIFFVLAFCFAEGLSNKQCMLQRQAEIHIGMEQRAYRRGSNCDDASKGISPSKMIPLRYSASGRDCAIPYVSELKS